MSARQKRLLTTLVIVFLVAVCAFIVASPKTRRPKSSKVATLTTTSYGSVLVVGSGELKGFPLYEFSGDVAGEYGCGTTLERGYDLDPNGMVKMTCTGPMDDIAKSITSDDWPAFTSTSKVIAGPGVHQKLLGTVHRRGVGYQVTYAGHPLYLFDPSTAPFAPAGEDYAETVEPTGPWHGYWFLVSSSNGEPAPGRATIEMATLPDGRKVVAEEMDPNVEPLAEALYFDSRDTGGATQCLTTCATTWIPVLTNGTPRVRDGIRPNDVGVLRLANGEHQVTFNGQPLYLYSKEKIFRRGTSGLKTTGTAGNGSGLPGPGGGTFRTLPVS